MSSFLRNLSPHIDKYFRKKKLLRSAELQLAESTASVSATTSSSPLPPPLSNAHGDSPPSSSLHYESLHESQVQNRCWTIKDFPTAVKKPKMLQMYKLQLEDAEPRIQFCVDISKNGMFYIVPNIVAYGAKEKEQFVKYFVSIGPHSHFGCDFSVESPLFQLKNLNGSQLCILEADRILKSYLVDGNLNIIIRFARYFPKTRVVQHSPLSEGGAVVECCSQFSFHRTQQQQQYQEDQWRRKEETDLEKGLCGEEDKRVLELEPEVGLEDEVDVPENEFFKTQVRSKPLRASRKSDFKRRKESSLTSLPKRTEEYGWIDGKLGALDLNRTM